LTKNSWVKNGWQRDILGNSSVAETIASARASLVTAETIEVVRLYESQAAKLIGPHGMVYPLSFQGTIFTEYQITGDASVPVSHR